MRTYTSAKEYIDAVIETARRRDGNKQEFLQCVKEVYYSLEKVIDAHPEYVKADILTRMIEPDRFISFRVAWVDDNGFTQINRGYRVQFNSAIGPYKGGLRFHPTVTPSVMFFLGFEQTFKNSLTGLYHYIGPDTDVPAGDIGVSAREIGYLFGQYKRIRIAFENGVITGKPRAYGGSLIRPEATGYGAVYYTNEVLNHENESIQGKTFAISGFGNVAWGAISKIVELGGIPLTISGPDGYIYDKDGIVTKEKIDYLLEMRASRRDRVQDYADKFGVPFYPGKRPWEVKADVAMPCATQNEVDLEDAKNIAANGTRYYIEVANMPSTSSALEYLSARENIIVAPSKAVNAGGVCVSGLEMSQNSQRLSWTAEEVDTRLKTAMKDIYTNSVDAAKRYGLGYNLVAGANIAGFEKVADAMMTQGIY